MVREREESVQVNQVHLNEKMLRLQILNYLGGCQTKIPLDSLTPQMPVTYCWRNKSLERTLQQVASQNPNHFTSKVPKAASMHAMSSLADVLFEFFDLDLSAVTCDIFDRAHFARL